MIENQNEFEGPRKVRLTGAVGGAELYHIPFPEDLDDAEKASPLDRLGGWYIFTRGGRMVSKVGLFHFQVELYGSRFRIGYIGGVGTDSKYRQQGLAGRLLAHCAKVLAEEGGRLMLISGERGLYTRTGNAPAMRFVRFTLKAPFPPSPFSPDLTVRPLVASDLLACARLYQAEPARFVRRPEDFAWYCSPTETGWMVEQEGVPRAYLLLPMPWESDEGLEPGVREVTEYAGSRLALVEGMRRALSGEFPLQPAIHGLRLAVPWQDHDLLQLLQRPGIPPEMTTLPGHTMRLVNFPALRQDLASYIQARLPKNLQRGLRFGQSGPLLVDPQLGPSSDGRMSITWNGSRKATERLELSSAEMTALVMGSCSPFPAMRGALGEIVPALFPLPSFLPGINYR